MSAYFKKVKSLMQVHTEQPFIVVFQSFFSCLAGLTAGLPSRPKQGHLSVSLRETDRQTDRLTGSDRRDLHVKE